MLKVYLFGDFLSLSFLLSFLSDFQMQMEHFTNPWK